MAEERDDLDTGMEQAPQQSETPPGKRPARRGSSAKKAADKAETNEQTDNTGVETDKTANTDAKPAKKTATRKKTAAAKDAGAAKEEQNGEAKPKKSAGKSAVKEEGSEAKAKPAKSSRKKSSAKKEITDTATEAVEKAADSKDKAPAAGNTVETQGNESGSGEDAGQADKPSKSRRSRSGARSKTPAQDGRGGEAIAESTPATEQAGNATDDTVAENAQSTDSQSADSQDTDAPKKRSRSRRRKSAGAGSAAAQQNTSSAEAVAELEMSIENIEADGEAGADGTPGEEDGSQGRKRSRRRRGGRKHQGENSSADAESNADGAEVAAVAAVAMAAGEEHDEKPDGEKGKSSKKRKPREKKGRSIRELHNNRVEEVRAAAEASAKLSKDMIINVTTNEITIAMLENKQLVELSKEQCKTGYAVGDIYLGKVRKIMPGLNAAFVSIGHEKDAFMHYLDLGPNFMSLHKLTAALTGNKKLPSFDKLKFEPILGKNGKISNYISAGQPIIVQIAKEAISTKGPRLTSEISLAGRHVVLMPFSNKISISQKIRSNEERRRLKKIVDSVLPHNYGVIIRTAAVGKEESDVASDITTLVEKWETAMAKVRGQQPPQLLMNEMNRATTIIRDLLNGSFNSISIDDKTMYEEVKEYIKQIAPEKEKIVKLYKGNVPIFDNFDISKQIQGLFAKYVSLRKGAYLIVEHTEALHVIDVNSGNRAKVDDDQEHTAMTVNLAAAEEIARQLRLRDMGGIIVIDFIDLHKGDNRQLLYEKMQGFMALDRAKHTILPLSKFGLMQITRQRVRPEAIVEVTEVCPACNGTGAITPTVLLDQQIENQIAYLAGDRKEKYIRLRVSPYVAAFLTKGIIPLYRRWGWKYKTTIKVVTDPTTGFVETKFFDKNDNELI